MKIVINDCPGEFSLSEEAVTRYVRIKNQQGQNMRLFLRRTLAENFYYLKDKNLRKNDEDGLWHPKKDIPRNDPILVNIVETMGQKANTIYSNLKVKEIDDSQKWAIVENDGKETIAFDPL